MSDMVSILKKIANTYYTLSMIHDIVSQDGFLLYLSKVAAMFEILSNI